MLHEQGNYVIFVFSAKQKPQHSNATQHNATQSGPPSWRANGLTSPRIAREAFAFGLADRSSASRHEPARSRQARKYQSPLQGTPYTPSQFSSQKRSGRYPFKKVHTARV